MKTPMRQRIHPARSRSKDRYCDQSTCACRCFIIPSSVLERFAEDDELSAAERRTMAEMARYEKEWRKLRVARIKHIQAAQTLLPSLQTIAPAGPPSNTAFTCQKTTSLPGTPVTNPMGCADATVKRAATQAAAVATFYQTVFGRNSIDHAGLGLVSSVHYGLNYNNAFWTGSQMVYGDGDGKIFIDFTKSSDVIAHELTHGVTQYSLGLNYSGEAGGLNESMSDVFGSMFRQWQANQTVDKADWLIGKEIMGPAALGKGYTCLRDLADPGAHHCLSPQPVHFSQFNSRMDPHDSSGIPNLAFYKAAMAIGGNSWEKAGKIWYEALTGFRRSPAMRMAAFAKRTRSLAQSLFPSEPAVFSAVDQAWTAVGL